MQQGAVQEQDVQVVQAELKVLYFDYDRYTLSPEAQAACQYNADILRRAPHLQVVAEGHCDERGTAEYNLALGERRARSVQEFLVGLGVAPTRITTVSYGSELPVDPGHNEAAWSQNRRVYLRVHH
jgi:peptidoglycan-associated lipoprotein